MDDPREVSGGAPQGTGTRASAVYDRLRDDILQGRLEPGSRLRLQHLASHYEVGNSPLREALNRLSSNGLVTREENKGFRVSPASVAELEELIRTRCLLETKALGESIANGAEEWEERVVLAFHRLDRLEKAAGSGDQHRTPEWEAAHREYHTALLSACGSGIMLEFCSRLHDQTLRYRRLAEVVLYRDVHECSEHRKIQEAVLARDADRAARMLRAHYTVTLDIILSSGALD